MFEKPRLYARVGLSGKLKKARNETLELELFGEENCSTVFLNLLNQKSQGKKVM